MHEDNLYAFRALILNSLFVCKETLGAYNVFPNDEHKKE